MSGGVETVTGVQLLTRAFKVFSTPSLSKRDAQRHTEALHGYLSP